MRIYIEYVVPTASGKECLKSIIAYTIKDAEEYCEIIERIGYKIKMVNNEP